MVSDAQRAIVTSTAVGLRLVLSTIHGIVVASLAEEVSHTAADELGDVAAVHAFVVDKGIAMKSTVVLAFSHFLRLALLAEEALLGNLVFLFHGLLAILHTAKERLLAFVALIEGAILHGELVKLAMIVVSFFDHSSSLVIAAFDGLLSGHLLDLSLVLCILFDLLGQAWHIVVDSDLLLAAGAVHVAKIDLESA